MIILNPVFTHNIWGGTRLKTDFGYDIPGNDIGECWGISAHPNGDCTIADGFYEGETLSQLWNEHPELFGYSNLSKFPLLVKIIDAKNDLSIQVHPDDTYACKNEHGSLGKTECWYILDCKKDSSLIIGHNARTKEELSDMILHGKWNEFIREIPVKKGDFIQIDPGSVHAIKGGIELLETQQNSDITYRVYDYDRLWNGKPRQLHIQQSIDVITVPAKSIEHSIMHTDGLPANTLNELICCKYYKVFLLNVASQFLFHQDFPFLLCSVINGSGSLNDIPIHKGMHFILSYHYGNVLLKGNLSFICSTIPTTT